MKLLLNSLIVLMFVLGCGEDKKAGTNKAETKPIVIGDTEFVSLNNPTFATTNNTAEVKEQTVRLLSKTALGETFTEKSYTLSFNLNEQGSVKLITHALKLAESNEEKLTGGVTLNFTRNNGFLKLFVTYPSGKTEDKSIYLNTSLGSNDAKAAINVKLDIHNHKDEIHIVLPAKHLPEGKVEIEIPEKGNGNLWGLEITQATVTQAKIAGPDFKD